MRSLGIPNTPPPTLDDLIDHYDRFGCEEPRDGRSRLKPFATYRAWSGTSLAEVGFDYLDEDEHAELVKACGYPDWEHHARDDWRTEHGETSSETGGLPQGSGTEPGGVRGDDGRAGGDGAVVG